MSAEAKLAIASRIAGVCERDIDLLLLEEFQATPEFVSWFLECAGIERVQAHHLREAHRSITDTTGESDLELHFDDGAGSRDVVMIENKVSAQLQPLQAERYAMRGQSYLSRGLFDRFHTVIVAPDRYFADAGQTKGFRHRVSYDRILEWFERSTTLGQRRNYKISMLRSALDRATLGYQPVIDDAVTSFFAAYWDIATATYPELGMRRSRKERPGGSGRVYFKTAALTAIACDIAHKTGKGFVDLHLRGRGNRLAMVESALRRLLDPDMSVEPAAKSAAIRLHVAKLDRLQPVTDQQDALLQGLQAAKRLAQWAERYARDISKL